MEIKYWAGTDVGRKRSDNEDNFLIDKRLRLFVVADGMGGHASGEIASAMAVHGIREVLHQERDILDVYDDDDPKSHVEVCTLLEYAVHYTCAQIFQKARREPEKRGMGTTLVVLLVIGARGFIAYVGDSRIYLLRGGVVYQLTEDHSLRNELIRMGKITADEFESSPYANLKNAMTRAVGVYESVEVDTLDFDIIPGDAFLLCSDGLYEYLTDDDIAHSIALPEIREVPGILIDSANSRGGKDNITAVVVQVAGGADDKDRAAELNFTLDTLKTVPLFRELSYQQLVRVINLSRQSAVEPGQVLCREGEPGHELLVVLRGRVELTQGGVRVAELGTGAHLGEMALIDEGLRSVTVTALETGKVLAIGRDDFYEVLRREPALAVKLLWSFVRVLAGRLRTTTADLAVARTSVAQVMPDLTELAEETTRVRSKRAGLDEPGEEAPELDAEDVADDEDDLERRPTMISGMLRTSPVPLEDRTTLVGRSKPREDAAAASAAAPPPPPAAERSEPERSKSRPPIASPTGSEGQAADDGGVMSSAQPRPRSGPVEESDGATPPRARTISNPAITGATVVPPSAAPRPRTSSSPSITGDTVAAAAPPRPSSSPSITGDTVAAAAPPRPSSSPSITGDTVAAAAPPRPPESSAAPPRPPESSAAAGETPAAAPPRLLEAAPAPQTARPRTHSNPSITGVTIVPPPAVARPRTASSPNLASEPVPPPPSRAGNGPAAASEPAAPPSKPGNVPAVSGELAPKTLPPTNPLVSGELLPPRSVTSHAPVTGDTVVPPSAAPRPRRTPQVTKANEAPSWSPGQRPLGGARVVPSPQAPTAPLDAPHLLPPIETDAPTTRRPPRRTTQPQIPGAPTQTPSGVAPTPIHGMPTAPLAAPSSPHAPTAPLAAPILPPLVSPSSAHAPTAPLAAPILPPLAAPTTPLAAPIVSPVVPPLSSPPPAPARADVPSRRDEAITAPALPVVPPPPPPPARGGTLPPPSRGSTQPPPGGSASSSSPSRTEADSDAPRVPAPRHAGVTPQAGGTQPPPGSDGTSRAPASSTAPPAVPPPPPSRKNDPSDPSPAAEPGS